jgi:UDP-N-acetyl-D-mannosaminuronate dehydrogenase
LRDRKTLVVGLGEVGGALAEVLERTAPGLLRHDIERLDFAEPIGVMHICIPYQSREQFEAATLEYIARFTPELTIINSTVVPGTSRRIAQQSSSRLVYSPVRGKHARMTEDMLKYGKFVAADHEAAAAAAEQHFQAAGMKTRRAARFETLELAKLAETTYFGIQIAFAQELNRFAQNVEADYSEAINFFDEVEFLPRARYYPGFIGGHCVIPNIHLLKQLVNSPLLEAVLESNQRRAAELADENCSTISAEDNGRARNANQVLANR